MCLTKPRSSGLNTVLWLLSRVLLVVLVEVVIFDEYMKRKPVNGLVVDYHRFS